MNNARDTIDRLAALTHQLVAPLGDPGNGYALLDFPNYSNIGDSLIWLGELAYFDRHAGRPASYVCTTYDFDPHALRRALPAGPVYLSGGGNFGDIWPRFQAFRVAVLDSMQGRAVIQLPQTLLFRDEANVRLTREAIKQHGNFTLMVRDQRSFHFARDQLDCKTILAPDMAFSMGPLTSTLTATRDATYLVRSDKEASADRGTIAVPNDIDALVTDWIRESPVPTLANRIVGALRKRLDRRSSEAMFRETANSERGRGLWLLCGGRAVVTDRLHGHILALLIGLPQIVVDNNYGKLSGFMDAWTGSVDTVHRARDFAEAATMLRGLIERPS
jgi:exopolysaccharide biosynthesis predicted pyruvyltransferase EpsI